ncbi:hypothetical protein L3Q82_016523 [Scortum barcoo]|uniref:Uncharacterized protein n=1 Tax=Scortum barcoo TaxID=214431 RepID=A0ACB8X7P3_9TELE|nr:hypothetical protein L3Q82_016523 [Scortum barcoo]
MKAAQQEVKHCVKEAKDSYRRKVEQKLRDKQHEGGQRTAEEASRPRKAAGPDKVCPRLLKTCAAELGEPLQRIFNLSLQIGRVPTLWKTSRIVPVPKKNRPSELNDFRPVALTSHLMKTRWSGSSSASSDPSPLCFEDKLSRMGVDPQLMDWISDYLTGRPQYIGLKDITSDTVVSSTGAPRAQCWPLFSSPCTPQTSATTRSCVTFRNTLMTQPSLGALGMTERRSIGDW